MLQQQHSKKNAEENSKGKVWKKTQCFHTSETLYVWKKIAAKFYIFVTQTVAVMLRLMEANHSAAF